MTIPTGTLMKKIQCQLIAWVRMPPSSRPIEPPEEATKPKTPIAFAWSRGAGNIVTIMPRITAEVSAPLTPCRKRAPISMPWVSETAQSSDENVNALRPMRKIRRWPIRSPMRPDSSSSPPKAIR